MDKIIKLNELDEEKIKLQLKREEILNSFKFKISFERFDSFELLTYKEEELYNKIISIESNKSFSTQLKNYYCSCGEFYCDGSIVTLYRYMLNKLFIPTFIYYGDYDIKSELDFDPDEIICLLWGRLIAYHNNIPDDIFESMCELIHSKDFTNIEMVSEMIKPYCY